MAVLQANAQRVERLRAQLDEMVNAQFETPEFVALFSTPLTITRARLYARQHVLYTLNRRDGWGYVSARAPFDVKQAIWHHEQDELIHDARGGTDHFTLISREARALGVTEAELAHNEPLPMIRAALYAFSHIMSTRPWLAALTAAHFLERRNNPAILHGGGASRRWRDKLVRELGIDEARTPSTNVHVMADEEHSDLIWEAIVRHVTDEQAYKTVLDGARECAAIDRAYRGAMAYALRAIE
jgi:pyrroloquinoline quinone (PQQ) biosynthesis protein C